MSIYRTFNRIPVDELHYFERRSTKENRRAEDDGSDWLAKRKARPCEHLLAATVAWCASLPPALEPKILCTRFPRIANSLANGWRDRDATMHYFDDLLTDKRGGRRGFGADVLEELHALKAFYEPVHRR